VSDITGSPASLAPKETGAEEMIGQQHRHRAGEHRMTAIRDTR